ncbi:MAG: hypothetical protein ACOH2L_16430 [Devosia sp.]
MIDKARFRQRTAHSESQLYYMGVLRAPEHVPLPAISHCFRRDAVYYWRRWTPAPRRILLQVSLAVKDPRTARRLSSVLTAKSEELFPLWSAGNMNKSQLLQYLHDCLAKGRRQIPRDGLADLAEALALRVLATRGMASELSTGDRVAIDRQWGQPGLADDVARIMTQTKRQPPDLVDFVDQSIAASLSVASAPTGGDAEQAAGVRLLAAASLAFQAAKELSVSDIGVDQLVAEIAGGQGLPDSSENQEPLFSWLKRTMTYLLQYNPYSHDGREDVLELDTILDDVQPTFLADWIRRGGPPKGSSQTDHQYLERQADALREILKGLPRRIKALEKDAKVQVPAKQVGEPRAVIPTPVLETPAAESASIAAVAEKLIIKQQQRGKWDDKSAKQATWTYFIFPKVMLEEFGITTFSELRQSHIEHFDDFLLAIYPSFGRGGRDRRKSIAEVRALSKTKAAAERWSPALAFSDLNLPIGTKVEYRTLALQLGAEGCPHQSPSCLASQLPTSLPA